jgi:polyisoprenyl-teichoic acid--peptidoglycan teichoic acid transferase
MIKKLLIIVGAFVILYVVYFAFRSFGFYTSIAKNGANNTPAPVEKTTYNVLLLGFGGEGHDGPYLTDSIMIAQVDMKKNKVALISLPRDLWVKLPTKTKEIFHSKINSIYQMGMYESNNYPAVIVKKPGSVELAKQAIQTVTGLAIDNTITVDFAGFEKAVDALGGIEVAVQKTFDDYEYPIEGKDKELCGKEEDFAKIEKFIKPGFDEEEKKNVLKDKPELEKFLKDISEDPKEAFPCRYEHLHFDKGLTFMDGKTALKYVRSRHSLQDGNDFGRAERQQQFVKALKNKILSVGIVTKIFPLMEQLQSHITVDVSPGDLNKFAGEAKDIGQYKIINIHMSDSDYLKSSFSDYGGYILIPRAGEDNWREVKNMIQMGILEITPTPSPKPTSKISPTSEKAK